MSIDPFAVRALLGPDAAVCRRAVSGEHGIALPPLIDHHVHSHLADVSGMPSRGIAGVVDLGGDPVALVRDRDGGMPHVAYAGAFLTAPGGYPSGRSWAPASTVRQIAGNAGLGVAGGIDTAVDEQAAFGASVIKVALNANAGPVFDAATLAAVLATAHDRGLPVVAHVEGVGMARLALDAGVDTLAHTPFSDLLDDAELAAAVARGQRWISTLTIHEGADRERAEANLGAFAAAGGSVLYGTDLGNGDQPLGINPAELGALRAAGLSADALVRALADPWPLDTAPAGVATFVPGRPPTDDDAVPGWLAGAIVVPAEELVHDD